MARVIRCVCYRKVHTFKKRKDAIEFFETAMMNSEGAERERYFNIWEQLKAGRTFCYDYIEDAFNHQ
jgi:hypothetical protein